MRKLLVISGIPIDDLNMEEALDRLSMFVETGRATGKTHQVATVNADFVVKSTKDPELRYLLQDADMATADGMPLVWGARLLNVPLEGRVTGADLVPALATRAAERGYSIYLLGAGPGIAVAAAEILKKQNPNLKIVGTVSPPFGPIIDMDPAIIEDIKQAKPDILLVAFGNPKQEKWIGMYGHEVGVPVMIGIGGTLDFIAGKTKRAPEWMQRSGTEWIYRLLQEPRRLWKRYVIDLFSFSSFFLRQWWVMRQGRRVETIFPATDVVLIDRTAILSPQGRVDISNNEMLARQADEALKQTTFLIVNLSNVTFLDSAAIGTLVGLTKRARDAGGELWLASVPKEIERTLAMLHLQNFFAMVPDVVSGVDARSETLDPEPIHHNQGTWTIVEMPRRIDASSTDEIATTCEKILQENEFLVLDLSETVFLTSAGLAAMARLNRIAQDLGGEVRIAGCSSDIQRVIKMVRFDRVFNIHPNVASAIA